MTAPEPAALDRHSIGLFLDVDGTIIDLAPTPDAVDVPTALLQELASAERRLDGALALVSGRPIKDLDRLFKPLRLRASGVHGGEIRFACCFFRRTRDSISTRRSALTKTARSPAAAIA